MDESGVSSVTGKLLTVTNQACDELSGCLQDPILIG
jgi:hypothetical protein